MSPNLAVRSSPASANTTGVRLEKRQSSQKRHRPNSTPAFPNTPKAPLDQTDAPDLPGCPECNAPATAQSPKGVVDFLCGGYVGLFSGEAGECPFTGTAAAVKEAASFMTRMSWGSVVWEEGFVVEWDNRNFKATNLDDLVDRVIEHLIAVRESETK